MQNIVRKKWEFNYYKKRRLKYIIKIFKIIKKLNISIIKINIQSDLK